MTCHPKTDAEGSVALREAGSEQDFRAGTDSKAAPEGGLAHTQPDRSLRVRKFLKSILGC
jgi:hypothetical protein